MTTPPGIGSIRIPVVLGPRSETENNGPLRWITKNDEGRKQR